MQLSSLTSKAKVWILDAKVIGLEAKATEIWLRGQGLASTRTTSVEQLKQ